MADLIDRQKAIEAIKEFKYTDRFFKSYAIDILKEQPTAEITLDMVNDYCRPRCLSVFGNEALERYKPVRHGHWSIDDSDWFETFYRCTVCKKRSRIRTSYCPNCGAKMDEVKHETD